MAPTEKQKQSLYFPEDMLREIMEQANRLDRSLSWMVQQAWRLAREQLRSFPSVDPRGRVERARPLAHEERGAEVDQHLPSPELRAFLRGKFERELTS